MTNKRDVEKEKRLQDRMKTRKLERSGKRPLCFVGELLAPSSSTVLDGRENDRWYEIQLYRTDDDRFVVSVTFDSEWQDEERNVQVKRFKSIQSVAEFLRDEYYPFQFTNVQPHLRGTKRKAFALLRNYNIAMDAI